MMPVGVRYQRGRIDAIQVYPADDHSPVVRKSKAVATATITENNCSVARYGTIRAENVKGGNGRTGALDPGFNRKVLQLQVGWVSEIHPVSVGAVEHEGLTDEARTVGHRSRSSNSPVVAIRSVIRIPFGPPPTDHTRGRGGAGHCGRLRDVGDDGRGGPGVYGQQERCCRAAQRSKEQDEGRFHNEVFFWNAFSLRCKSRPIGLAIINTLPDKVSMGSAKTQKEDLHVKGS